MKWILEFFLIGIVISFAKSHVTTVTPDDCSEEAEQKCRENDPNTHGSATLASFMTTEEDLDKFCYTLQTTVPCQYEFEKRCRQMDPLMENVYKLYNRFSTILCENTDFRKKYLSNAVCLNEALQQIEGCISNDASLHDDEALCRQTTETLECSDDLVKSNCGDDALVVFQEIYHSTYTLFTPKPANCHFDNSIE